MLCKEDLISSENERADGGNILQPDNIKHKKQGVMSLKLPESYRKVSTMDSWLILDTKYEELMAESTNSR